MWEIMGPVGWVVLGGLAGWIASKFVGTDKEQGLLGNILAGIIGAFVGGWVISLIGGEGMTGFNIWSFVVAVIGAVIVLMIWKALTGRKK
jgi:uncharacterized membrane protein YeaQ/YmgE (transglycosylase-associated protein family)